MADSIAPLCAVLVVSLAAVCCSSRSEMDRVIGSYIRAVQNLDAPQLAGVSAVPMAGEGGPGEGSPGQRLQLLETRLDQRFMAHLEQRDAGHLESGRR